MSQTLLLYHFLTPRFESEICLLCSNHHHESNQGYAGHPQHFFAKQRSRGLVSFDSMKNHIITSCYIKLFQVKRLAVISRLNTIHEIQHTEFCQYLLEQSASCGQTAGYRQVTKGKDQHYKSFLQHKCFTSTITSYLLNTCKAKVTTAPGCIAVDYIQNSFLPSDYR